MRKLCLVALCLFTVPLYAQRHRGYTPNGGWHQKVSTPVPARRAVARKDKAVKNKAAKTPPVVPAAQKY